MGVVVDGIRRRRFGGSRNVKQRIVHGIGCYILDRPGDDLVELCEMNEPYVNRELMQRVLEARDRTLDQELFSETVNITDLYYKTLNYTEEELIMSVIAALQVCPDKVYQVLAYDRAELIRKGKKKDGNID